MSRTNRVFDGDRDSYRIRQIALNHAVDVTLPTAPMDTLSTDALLRRAAAIEAFIHGAGTVVTGETGAVSVNFGGLTLDK